MPYDPEKHHRRSIRLKGYDYSQPGAYFVTIVTHNRVCLFGEAVNGDMRLNRYGEIVQHAWFDLSRHYPYVRLGAFCVMPNHIHAIIIIVDDNHDDDGNDDVGAGLRPAPTWVSPADCGAIPGDDGAARVDDRASPTDVGAPPVDGGAAPADDGAAPADCGAIPIDDGAASPRHPLPEIVRALKSFSARRINDIRQTPGVPVWQRNYYDRIIRNAMEYNCVHHYIETNPARWMNDRNNPQKRR